MRQKNYQNELSNYGSNNVQSERHESTAYSEQTHLNISNEGGDANSSFNSLPEGETYHWPPDDEEDDPFDTSSANIVINNCLNRTSEDLNMSSSSDANNATLTRDQPTAVVAPIKNNNTQDANNFSSQASVTNNYASQASAASNYASQASGISTYASQATVASNYAFQEPIYATVNKNYAPQDPVYAVAGNKPSQEPLYATVGTNNASQSSASTNYAFQTSVASNFPPQTLVSSNFPPQTSIASNYPPQPPNYEASIASPYAAPPPPASVSQGVSTIGNGESGPPSIISQLLASQSSKPERPPPPQVQPVARNTIHRRAMSCAADVDGFFPPLSSPFSPPAFNPYDVDLGSNEAIAGMDSPAPFRSKERDQAFSWLEKDMADMKLGSRTPTAGSGQGEDSQEKSVFQFPPVAASVNDVNAENLKRQEEKKQKELNLKRQEEQRLKEKQAQLLIEDERQIREREENQRKERSRRELIFQEQRLEQEKEEKQKEQEREKQMLLQKQQLEQQQIEQQKQQQQQQLIQQQQQQLLQQQQQQQTIQQQLNMQRQLQFQQQREHQQ